MTVKSATIKCGFRCKQLLILLKAILLLWLINIVPCLTVMTKMLIHVSSVNLIVLDANLHCVLNVLITLLWLLIWFHAHAPILFWLILALITTTPQWKDAKMHVLILLLFMCHVIFVLFRKNLLFSTETVSANMVMNTIMSQITAHKFVVMDAYLNPNVMMATLSMVTDVAQHVKFKTTSNVIKPYNHHIARHYFS